MEEEPRTVQPTDPTLELHPGPAPTRAPQLAEPQVVGGYRIEKQLGRGGMGDVYVGFDVRLRRRVALKAIRAERRLNREARERFLREARVLSSLDHPHICRIHDYLESDEGDYLVLELIDGADLDRVLPTLGFTEKLRIAEKIAGVLAAAHAAGIVHRDLKPGNVMLTDAGEVKVLDFGIARMGGEKVEAKTPKGNAAGADTTSEASATRSLFLDEHTHGVVGTPHYMSPEQARGEPVGPASDLYSFGLVLQEIFTGRRPYGKGLRLPDLLREAGAGRSRAVTGVDRQVTALIASLKVLDPPARPTAAEAAARLRWIRDRPRRRVRRLAIVALAAVAVLAWLKYTLDLKSEREQAIAARNEAIKSRNEVEEQMTFMLGDLGPHLDAIGRTEVVDAVAERAFEYLSRVPEEHFGDDDLWRRAKALHLLGQAQLNRGSMAEAEEAFVESVGLATGVVHRHPERPQWLADLGASHFYVGLIQMDQGDLDGALQQFRIYREVADRLVELDGPRPRWRLEQAYAHNNLGAVLERKGDFDGASAEIEASLVIKRDLADSDPEDAEAARSLANGLSWLASVRYEAGDTSIKNDDTELFTCQQTGEGEDPVTELTLTDQEFATAGTEDKDDMYYKVFLGDKVLDPEVVNRSGTTTGPANDGWIVD